MARLARVVLAVCALGIVLHYLLTPGIFGSKAQGDGWYGFHYLPALVQYHTVDMKPVVGAGPTHFDHGPGGKVLNRNPIGLSIALVPVYTGMLAIELCSRLLFPTVRRATAPFQISDSQVHWTGLLTALAGVLGMLLLYRLLRRHVSAGPALCGAVTAVFATPVFWYLSVQPHYQHGMAFAAVTLLLERWDATRGRLAPRRFFVLGTLGGVAMLLRTQEFVFLLVPGSELLLLAARRRREPGILRRALLCGALLAAGALLAFLPQLAVWSYYFGFLARPTTVEPLRPLAPAIVSTLLSSRCGLLPWSPAVYLAALGLLLGVFGRWRALVGPLLLLLLADVYLVAASFMWYGAFGFGSRRLSDCAPIFGLGVALLCQRAAQVDRRGLRRLFEGGLALLLAAFLALNMLLIDLGRRRKIPSSGSQARPAYRWAELCGAPQWLVGWLRRHGYPFVQPAGWIFAALHHAPPTAWEAVVGNYALEREPHGFYVFGDRWDFNDAHADDHIIEGLLPQDSSSEQRGRPVAARVRMLLQPFGREPIRASLVGDFEGPVAVAWDGHPLQAVHSRGRLDFLVPEPLVHPHRVSELTLSFPASATPPRVSRLDLHSFTTWWKKG